MARPFLRQRRMIVFPLYSRRREIIPMTPSETLVVKTMESNLQDGYDAGTALIRSANTLGLSRERVLNIWVQSLAERDAA